jgi:hypothetical protein
VIEEYIKRTYEPNCDIWEITLHAWELRGVILDMSKRDIKIKSPIKYSFTLCNIGYFQHYFDCKFVSPKTTSEESM